MLSRCRRWVWLGILSMLIAIGLSVYPLNLLTVAEESQIQPPLSTIGSQIVDARNQPVMLRGINWFGIETETHVPHGLWARDYREMLQQMRELGYNFIRLPFSLESLRAEEISGVDFRIGRNQDFEGKSPLEAMDLIVQAAAQENLMILLDLHQLSNKQIPELWYGDGYTEEDWINTWLELAEHYRNQRNVIGADLKNEPHGRASWGTGDRATDWRLTAERAGNAILKVNPDWLIVVQGVEKNVPGQRLPVHWWGGNLEGVRNYPVRLSRLNKLVYSPHEYGPGVTEQTWFEERSFPDNLYRRWEIGFNYINRLRLAPVLVGEFGGRKVGRSNEGTWQRLFIDYLQENNLHFAYWSWNPNSDDTGGILTDDWRAINEAKQRLLNPLLAGNGFYSSNVAAVPPSPSTPAPEVPAPPETTPSVETPADETPAGETPPEPIAPPNSAVLPDTLQVVSKIQSDWQTGFCTSFQVINLSDRPISDWQLTFQMNQADIVSSWNGGFRREGTSYVLTAPNWGQTVQPGQTIDIGFCANKRGNDYAPVGVAIGPRQQPQAQTRPEAPSPPSPRPSSISGDPSPETVAPSAPAPSPSSESDRPAAPATPVISPSLSQSSSPPTPALALATDLQVEAGIESDWQDGFCFRIQVTNLGSDRSSNWQLSFRMNQADINNSWNGVFSRQGTQYTVSPPSWGRALEPDQTIDMGFCANKQGSDYQPGSVTLTTP